MLGLGLAALATAAAAIASSFNPIVRRTGAGTLIARTALLQKADFGASWKQVTLPAPSPSAIGCPTLAPDQSGLVETGLAQVGFVDGPWRNVTDAVRVFATNADSRISWSRTDGRTLVACVAQSLEQQGFHFKRTQGLTLTHVAPRTAAYRIVASMSRPPSLGKTPNLVLPVFSDIVLLSNGPTQEILIFNSIVTPFSHAYEQRIAGMLARRLKGPVA